MKFVYYLFGYLSQDISKLEEYKKFHYLNDDILCGDTMSTITKKEHGIKITSHEMSKVLNIKLISSSMTWSLISLIDANFDGFIMRKDEISDNKESYQVTGKWKHIICFSENSAFGISNTNDLFYITFNNTSQFTIERFPSKLKVDSLACGSDHVLIISSGRILSKGLGSRGQLGHGELENSAEFREIVQLGCVVSQIACGFWHSIALTEAGDVYSWGWNESGQLGVPCFTDRECLRAYFDCVDDLEEPSTLHTEPVMVTFPIDDWSITKIDCGSRHTACLNDDGQVFAFGWGVMGQVGREDGLSYDYPVAIDGFRATDIRCTQWGTVIAVESHPCALHGDNI